MRVVFRVLRGLLPCAMAVVLHLPAEADEGMWTFDNFPAAAVNAKYHTAIDQPWLDHVRASTARLSSGCSSSVVSAYGLVLTNHHCVRGCAQQLSTAKVDYVKNGFTTAARRDERLCPGMQAELLTSISDVTDAVHNATAGKQGQDFVHARDAAVAGLESSRCREPKNQFRCQVVNLYQGGQFKLYTYRKYNDVRLVFAPELQTAFFGGDPDNFNFPRYDLDCSFLRLYESGQPAATPTHLTWNAAAPHEGDPVFVAGNPGATQRLLTADQLESLRDLSLPITLFNFAELRGRLIRFGEETPEHARIADETLFIIENSFKALRGEEQALLDPGILAAKRRADADLRAKVNADPKLHGDIGDPWTDIATIQADRAALYLPYALTEAGPAGLSQLYVYAVQLVRAAAERPKPSGERLREYADARLPLLEKIVLDPQPVYPALEQVVLEFWLSKLREDLTVDAPAVQTFLGRESPEALSKRLATSHLGDPALRRRLWDGGAAAIAASTDPMIQFVRATDPIARQNRGAYETRVTAPSDAAAQRIARARFAVFGTGAYPDATFTLRLSYGAVSGWSHHGEVVPAVTRFAGLYDRATGAAPFDLAPRWIGARQQLNPATVFDIATTNDIIGGNSGSPLIDAHGEVIGAIFDGNIHSLGGAYAYDPALNRAVAVSTAAITEALRTVYGQQALAAELVGS